MGFQRQDTRCHKRNFNHCDIVTHYILTKTSSLSFEFLINKEEKIAPESCENIVSDFFCDKMQIFVVPREASNIKTLDIDPSYPVKVIKAFIDLRLGINSSQQRWAIVESKKSPNWVGRIETSIFNVLKPLFDKIMPNPGRKKDFQEKLNTYILPHCPVGFLGTLLSANLSLRLFEEKKTFTIASMFIGFCLGYQLSASVFNNMLSKSVTVLGKADKFPQSVDINLSETVEDIRKNILKKKDIPIEDQIFIIVQDYDHGLRGLLELMYSRSPNKDVHTPI